MFTLTFTHTTPTPYVHTPKAELKEEREHREGQMEQMEMEKAQWLSLEQQLRQEVSPQLHLLHDP